MKCLTFYLFLNVNIDRPNTSVILKTVSQSLEGSVVNSVVNQSVRLSKTYPNDQRKVQH